MSLQYTEMTTLREYYFNFLYSEAVAFLVNVAPISLKTNNRHFLF